jgi:hypothetical protein
MWSVSQNLLDAEKILLSGKKLVPISFLNMFDHKALSSTINLDLQMQKDPKIMLNFSSKLCGSCCCFFV